MNIRIHFAVILLPVLLLIGCQSDGARAGSMDAACPVLDTAAVRGPLDSLVRVTDSLTVALEAAHAKADSLAEELFLARLTIEKVRFYVRLVLQKPTQRKFLLGWIRRAVGL